MHEGQSVHEHCMTVIKDIEELEKLELDMQKKLQMDLILQSLTSSYCQYCDPGGVPKAQRTKAKAKVHHS